LLVPIISATWEAEIRRIEMQGQFLQKAIETLSQQISCVWWFAALISVGSRMVT
jgi:hypothetical protein